jgi:superfamily II DNA/RNA helicase
VQIPDSVKISNPLSVNYLKENNVQITIKAIVSPEKDKLETLGQALRHLRGQPGIVFCSFRDAVQRTSNYLKEIGIPHDSFHGGMEQRDRERALIKFRNGTHQLLIATDLAARGIDIPEIKFIIHYHLPLKREEFTHRNGRTARMHREGTAYILHWVDEELPDFIPEMEIEKITEAPLPVPTPWTTLFISGGRQDKISKGDIAGLFFKQGKLERDQVGNIELKADCAFVAVATEVVETLIPLVNNTRLKKKKVRIFEV